MRAPVTSFISQYRQQFDDGPSDWRSIPAVNSEGGEITFEVQGLDPIDFRVWAISDKNIRSELSAQETDVALIGGANPPTNLRSQTTFINDAGGAVPVLRALWDGPDTQDAVSYLFRWSKNQGEVTTLKTSLTQFDLEGASTGTYQLEVAAIDTQGRLSNFVEAEVDFLPDVPVADERITGLEIINQDIDREYTGRDIKLQWRVNSTTFADFLEESSLGADSPLRHPTFATYLVQVLIPSTETILREEEVVEPRYTYTYEKNLDDGKRRELCFRVYLRDANNNLSKPAAILVDNEVPGKVTNIIVTPKVETTSIEFDPPTDDPDFEGVRVDVSTTPNFTPSGSKVGEGTLAALAKDSPITIPTVFGSDFYLKLAGYDAFGKDPVNLIYSSEFLVPQQLLSITFDNIEEGALFTTLDTSGSPSLVVPTSWTEITGARLTAEGLIDRSQVRVAFEGNYIVSGTLAVSGLLQLRLERGSGSSPSSWTVIQTGGNSEKEAGNYEVATALFQYNKPGTGTWTYRITARFYNKGDPGLILTMNSFNLTMEINTQ